MQKVLFFGQSCIQTLKLHPLQWSEELSLRGLKSREQQSGSGWCINRATHSAIVVIEKGGNRTNPNQRGLLCRKSWAEPPTLSDVARIIALDTFLLFHAMGKKQEGREGDYYPAFGPPWPPTSDIQWASPVRLPILLLQSWSCWNKAQHRRNGGVSLKGPIPRYERYLL